MDINPKKMVKMANSRLRTVFLVILGVSFLVALLFVAGCDPGELTTCSFCEECGDEGAEDQGNVSQQAQCQSTLDRIQGRC